MTIAVQNFFHRRKRAAEEHKAEAASCYVCGGDVNMGVHVTGCPFEPAQNPLEVYG
jgi:hypothetical protein